MLSSMQKPVQVRLVSCHLLGPWFDSLAQHLGGRLIPKVSSLDHGDTPHHWAGSKERTLAPTLRPRTRTAHTDAKLSRDAAIAP